MSQNISFNLVISEPRTAKLPTILEFPNTCTWSLCIWSYISRCTLLLDEGFGLEEVSLTTLLELAELKPMLTTWLT